MERRPLQAVFPVDGTACVVSTHAGVVLVDTLDGKSIRCVTSAR
jgi:hypothetical protein